MHMQTTTILCCALLLGFATATQNIKPTKSSHLYGDIEALVDGEGSGEGKEVQTDLEEASGSGHGSIDDDDDNEREPEMTALPPTTTTTKEPRGKKISEDSDFDFTPDSKITHSPTNPNIFTPISEMKPTSFFAQPGILAAAIGGAIVGLLCAILVVMFIVYRMRRKDEGVYALEETQKLPTGRK